MSKNPPQRRNARARNGVALYGPASFCRGAESAGNGAIKGGVTVWSLQACP
ncbi:hypothetical protein FSG11_023965 [Escherichia coli]|nr:hypothetical protein [Escherichia coli]MCK2989380.1 hypothetical protein [Escherichia coli]MCK2994124.1 hypothetical protein [Escherichia coli]